jgi:hypothetical protein
MLHYIYRQLQTNSSNKIKFTDIALYSTLQQQFHKDIIKGKIKVDIFIYC